MGFADFVPLSGDAPRFVPFRVGGELVMVDLERHEIAWRREARAAWATGWSLRAHDGIYYALDYGYLGVFDGARGTLSASVAFKKGDDPAAVGAVALAGDSAWLFGTSADRRPVVGQLSARTLEPRPGSEGLVGKRVEGDWPPTSGWWSAM
jgi:hypothetical protein